MTKCKWKPGNIKTKRQNTEATELILEKSRNTEFIIIIIIIIIINCKWAVCYNARQDNKLQYSTYSYIPTADFSINISQYIESSIGN